MDEESTPKQPRPPFTPSVIEKDPDAGQVTGPQGQTAEDPAARSLYRGCLFMLLTLAIVIGVFTLLSRFFFAEQVQ